MMYGSRTRLAVISCAIAAFAVGSADGGGGDTFTEDFEAFAFGPVSGQFGWLGGVGAEIAAAGLPGGGTRSLVLTAPMSGNTAAQHEFNPTPEFVSVDLDFSGSGLPKDGVHTTGLVLDTTFAARLFFWPDGGIDALQVGDQGVGMFVDTGAVWVDGATNRYTIEVAPGNTVRMFQDGNLMFTGHNILVELGEGEGVTDLFVQTFFGQMIIDNIEGEFIKSADLDGSGGVDGADLGLLLQEWGQPGGPADLNGDGMVDGADLGLLLQGWSP